MPSSATGLSAPPLHGYRGEAPTPAPRTRPAGLVVAISREAGARGWSIAKKVADLLGWQVYDTETLDYLVQNETARNQFFAEVPEAVREWAMTHLAYLRARHKLNPDPDTSTMIELLLAVAARGDAVIVGRGAGFLLPPETTVHIRIIAPLTARVKYFAQSLRLTHEEALAEVRARDDRRAQFLQATIGRDPADLTAYDAVINAERLGIEGAAQFISWAVRTKQMFAEIKAADQAMGRDEVAGT